LSAEVVLCELLFLRAILLGVEPAMHGGEAFNRAKIRRFKSCNGPASNWIDREDVQAASPLFAFAVKAERRRHGVPSKVPARRRKRLAVGGAA